MLTLSQMFNVNIGQHHRKKQHQFYYVILFLYLKKISFLQKFASICLCCRILSFFSSAVFILISLSKNLSKSSFFEFLDLVLNRNCFCLFSAFLKNKFTSIKSGLHLFFNSSFRRFQQCILYHRYLYPLGSVIIFVQNALIRS